MSHTQSLANYTAVARCHRLAEMMSQTFTTSYRSIICNTLYVIHLRGVKTLHKRSGDIKKASRGAKVVNLRSIFL